MLPESLFFLSGVRSCPHTCSLKAVNFVDHHRDIIGFAFETLQTMYQFFIARRRSTDQLGDTLMSNCIMSPVLRVLLSKRSGVDGICCAR